MYGCTEDRWSDRGMIDECMMYRKMDGGIEGWIDDCIDVQEGRGREGWMDLKELIMLRGGGPLLKFK